jgi:hypothetical protein
MTDVGAIALLLLAFLGLAAMIWLCEAVRP